MGTAMPLSLIGIFTVCANEAKEQKGPTVAELSLDEDTCLSVRSLNCPYVPYEVEISRI